MQLLLLSIVIGICTILMKHYQACLCKKKHQYDHDAIQTQ